jgi:hypothetical protein
MPGYKQVISLHLGFCELARAAPACSTVPCICLNVSVLQGRVVALDEYYCVAGKGCLKEYYCDANLS